MCNHYYKISRLSLGGLILGGMVWGTGVIAASDRARAVTDMKKEVAEIGVLLETREVVFSPEALVSNVQETIVQAIDPGASILSPEQTKQYQEEKQGIFYDIGLKLAMKGLYPEITAVTPHGPAEAAGVPTKVLIETIDGRSTEDMTTEQVTHLLRGRKNELVTLVVRSEDKDAQAQTFKVTRSNIQMPVTGTMELWPQQIGYIKVNGLYKGSGGQVVTQINAWSGTNCIGVILDLRNANGTNLDAVAKIAGLFSHSTSTLFTIHDGLDKVLKTYTSKNDKPLDQPVMILVDQNTRDAAELLAAVLQDCRGVMIIGVPSHGDDRLREPITLTNGKVLIIAMKRLDIGKTSYNNKGVQPDIVVTPPTGEPVRVKESEDDDLGLFSKLSEQDKQDRALVDRIGNDVILRRATDILLGLKALDIHTR